MINYFIHQIGQFKDEETFDRLSSILHNKTIGSKEYLLKKYTSKKQKLVRFEQEDTKKKMYYDDAIHKDIVSLLDPQNTVLQTAIDKRDQQIFTCFDYRSIAIAVSRDVPLIPRKETHGLVVGEAQVKDKIEMQYIIGLILPIPKEELQNDKRGELILALTQLCKKYEFPIDIYNYEGFLINKDTLEYSGRK